MHQQYLLPSKDLDPATTGAKKIIDKEYLDQLKKRLIENDLVSDKENTGVKH